MTTNDCPVRSSRLRVSGRNGLGAHYPHSPSRLNKRARLRIQKPYTCLCCILWCGKRRDFWKSQNQNTALCPPCIMECLLASIRLRFTPGTTSASDETRL